MNAKTITTILCEYMNNICRVDDDENQTIQYGMELLLETILKLIVLILLGIFLKRGLETLIILCVFCGLRSQAGGMHAKTNLGCTICMLLIWGTSLLGYSNFKISDVPLCCIYVFSLFVIIYCAPATGYIEHFTKKKIWKKKVCAVFILTVFMFIGFKSINKRELLVYPIILEVVSLLPYNKIQKIRRIAK